MFRPQSALRKIFPSVVLPDNFFEYESPGLSTPPRGEWLEHLIQGKLRILFPALHVPTAWALGEFEQAGFMDANVRFNATVNSKTGLPMALEGFLVQKPAARQSA